MSDQSNTPKDDLKQDLQELEQRRFQNRKKRAWLIFLPFIFAIVLFLIAFTYVMKGQMESKAAYKKELDALKELLAAEKLNEESIVRLDSVTKILHDTVFIQKEDARNLNVMDEYANELASKLEVSDGKSRSARHTAMMNATDALISSKCPDVSIHNGKVPVKKPCPDPPSVEPKYVSGCPTGSRCVSDAIWTQYLELQGDWIDYEKYKAEASKYKADYETAQLEITDKEQEIESLKALVESLKE